LLLAAGCARMPPHGSDAQPEQAQPEEGLEILRDAALEFERASAAGDALAMAQAAARRRPIDRALAGGARTGADAQFLSARAMFAAARALAAGDAALLESIDELDSRSSSVLLDGFAGHLKRPGAPEFEERAIEEQQAVLEKGQGLPMQRLPAARLPAAGAVISVGPGKSVWMRAEVAKQRTLYVYAETKFGSAVRLSIFDVRTGEAICVDAQAHGFLLCRWRTEAPATGVVALSNAGAQQAAVLLIAHQ